ncbi:M48 family metalloprotease [Streptomyces eurocidicus]|uniref:Zn-dependent protease with chaperone function n=1 Tax=Streptomyces eurocidicus TaxID=66423 RepID=A0A7W8BG28_STREU|nr:M48 family metalloprotease [Streptomyces eurocidicus]MBB5121661.1 Zn-dependent protease with chaperone function [Streptomyces eurocidicus]MBF6052887.1 M48 family metalloprotease [Streptomyces eurocidicus]
MTPPAYPDAGGPPPYPDGAAPPPYPDVEAPPVHPGEAPTPMYPGGAPAGTGFDRPPPVRPEAGPSRPDGAPGTSVPAAPPPPYQDPAPSPPDGGARHDDLALQSGRKHLKAHQRGVDGASLAQLVMSLPVALISLSVVSFAFSLVDATLGLVMAAAWLLSGPLVFHRPAEAAIARHLLGMRRPTPAEAERLGAVWEEVTRRAGVSQGTYELWVQERAELNATAAAGHIVAVTRHAMDRLPNSRLAAVLAHELGHHVGGHTWAGMLADWYALPARTVWRWILAGLAGLLRSRSKANVACGGCLGLLLLQFIWVLAFQESMWWLVLPLVAAPVLIAWLHRRAEFRADDYAAGLGFRDDLMAVLAAEHQARSVPAVPPPGAPPMPSHAPHQPGTPPPHTAPATPPARKSAHSNFEARLQHLRQGAA